MKLTDEECDALIAEANQDWLRDVASQTQTSWQHYMIRAGFRAGMERAAKICEAEHGNDPVYSHAAIGYKDACETCAHAIREAAKD